jgi:RHS repeat-associated protein
VADGVRQQFVGYERDNETDLDFAEARYFSSKQGRFTSPDPLLESAELFQPQSWNRYSYVLNNPLLYIDPTGLIWVKNNENDKYYWINDDAWEEASKQTFNDGKQLYTPLSASQLEYDSADGRVVLDPRGPNPLNPAGFTVTPGTSSAGAIALGGLATTQIDSPLPGPGDVVGFSIMAYALYSWLTQDYGPLPIVDPNIFNKKAADSSKGEKHGDGGRALAKAEKQIADLLEKLKTATGKEAKKIKKTIENIRKTAQQKEKGTSHWN